MTKTCKLYGWTEDNIKISEPMVGHINHHVNNPLAVIQLHVGSMLNSDDPKVVESAEAILEQSERINQYVKWLSEQVEDEAA